ncbi:hypothetical protein [Pseudomonas sp. RGB]|uniref:hypothetical protein n=1 Tax=Pseudomonas sp. RGB TaxID=2598474 RepID=UPI001190E847|nr:hypothetical protein [Pseudomonas sp. RGB]TVT88015.1 hypothetical protein FPT15_26635 [Pseudomonas sp. RGB]
MINCRRSAKRTLALTLMLIWCLGGVSNANQAPSVLPSTSEPPVITTEIGKSISSISPGDFGASKRGLAIETELKILKEKNTLISDFQNSLISIVIWSLSAVVSVVILLVGASLFTNFKLHEKDVQRIQTDYDAKIKIFRSEVEASLAKAGQEMVNTQEARSQQDLNRMLDQAAQVRSQFEIVRLSLEEKFDQLLSGTMKFEAKLDSVEKNQIALRAELRKAETQIWEIKKIPANVLISSLQGLDAALASGDKWRIEDFFKQIKHVIKSDFIELRGDLDKELQQFIENRLIKFESEYPEHVSEIRQLIVEFSYLNDGLS